MEKLMNWECFVLILNLCRTSFHSFRFLSSHADGPPTFEEQKPRGSEGAGGGEGEGVSLWETFVTSMTALLDGWAASIWLQCM